MKKLLACDVDGTLLQTGHVLSPDIFEAVREFRKQGHRFMLCTGRTLNWVTPIFEGFPLEADGLILANGASLYLVEGLKPLRTRRVYSRAVPAAVGLEIITYLYHEEKVMLYWGDGEYTYQLEDRRLRVAETFNTGSEGTVFLSFEDYARNPMDFIGFGAAPLSEDPAEARRIRAHIMEHWGAHVNSAINMFFVDVMAKNISKGEGIRKMMEFLPEPYQCYAVGDSFNDEPMFRHVGKEQSFLMENGDSELLPLVRTTVPDVGRCIKILLGE